MPVREISDLTKRTTGPTSEYIFRTQFCDFHYLNHISGGGTPKRWGLVRAIEKCDVFGCVKKANHKEKTDFGGGKSLRGIRVNG